MEKFKKKKGYEVTETDGYRVEVRYPSAIRDGEDVSFLRLETGEIDVHKFPVKQPDDVEERGRGREEVRDAGR